MSKSSIIASRLDMDAVEANLTLKLKAKSGYRCTADYRISARQWGAIVKLCDKYALENERQAGLRP